jgi:hypothetical protein
MAVVNNALRTLNWTLNALLAMVLGMAAVIIYWVFEPDPLTVNYAKGYTSWSLCENREYSLVRDVQSSKDLTVNVKEYWWNMDGMDDVNGKMNEYPHKPLSVYTLSAGTDRVFDFPKAVPAKLKVGRYRYRPHAEYQINPIKTIRRDLPVQYVNVVCNYDPQKHGVVE